MVSVPRGGKLTRVEPGIEKDQHKLCLIVGNDESAMSAIKRLALTRADLIAGISWCYLWDADCKQHTEVSKDLA